MKGHRASLEAIRARPSDDAPRLAYADSLEREGDPERAEIIRVQCTLARRAEDAADRPALEDREHALLAAHERRWIGDVPHGVTATFERGFVGGIGGSASALVAHGQALFERHPITQLRVERDDVYELGPVDALGQAAWLSRVERLDSEGFPSVLTSQHLHSVRELTLQSCSGEPDYEIAATLPRCPSLARLEKLACPGVVHRPQLSAFLAALDGSSLSRLDLTGNQIEEEGIRELGRSRLAARLTDLILAENPLHEAGFRAVADLPCRLRHLDLSASARGLAGIAAVLAGPSAATLTSLALDARFFEENDAPPIGRGDLRAVGEASFWERAEALKMNLVEEGETAIDPLFRATATSRLRLLDLLGTHWYGDDTAQLCKAPFADALVEMAGTAADDDDIECIVAAGRFTRLRRLVLPNTYVSDRGASRLASAPSLARLRSLDLGRSELSARGVATLLDGPHWALARLDLSFCALGADGVDVLARSPRLARLERLNLAYDETLGGRALLPLAESPHLSSRCEVDLAGVGVDAVVREAFERRRR